MNNQRGGIISKVFLVPAGALVVVVVFVLGYYMGRYQERKAAEGEKPPTLPELANQYLPKKEDLTFYKTLTERGDKTVSIDLKAKQAEKKEEKASAQTPQPTEKAKADSGGQQKQEKQIEIKIDRKASSQQKQTDQKAKQPAPKKEMSASSAGASKLRYTVQIASYPDKALAEEAMRGMKKKGYAAFIVASELGGKGTWYRVRLGSFSSRASAEKLSKELKSKEGFDPFITVE